MCTSTVDDEDALPEHPVIVIVLYTAAPASGMETSVPLLAGAQVGGGGVHQAVVLELRPERPGAVEMSQFPADGLGRIGRRSAGRKDCFVVSIYWALEPRSKMEMRDKERPTRGFQFGEKVYRRY